MNLSRDDLVVMTYGLPSIVDSKRSTIEPICSYVGPLTIDYSHPSPCEIDPPDVVEHRYTDDCPIVKIHEAIRARIASMLHSIPVSLKKAQSKILSLERGMCIERASLQREIDVLVEKDKSLKDGSTWKKYVERAQPLLDEYLPLASSEGIGVVVINSSHRSIDSPEVLSKRRSLIRRYLIIASEYLKVNVYFVDEEPISCSVCGIDYSQMDPNDDRSAMTCHCGYQFPIISSSLTCRDSEQAEPSYRGGYDDRSTFLKRIRIYQGIQETDIPASLYTQLNAYLKENRCVTSEKAALLPHNEWGEKDGTSLQLLELALRETRNPDYYKDMDIIGIRLWGWKPHDIGHLVEKMIKGYDATQPFYHEIKEQPSATNLNLRLFQHLKDAGYHCRLEGFRIPVTRASLEYNDRMLSTMFERSGCVKYTKIL